MDFTDYGFFTHINPGQPGQPFFLHNADGVDYYFDLMPRIMKHKDQQLVSADHTAFVALNADGTVRNVYADPSAHVPVDATVIGLDMDPAEIHEGMIWDAATTSFLAPPPPEITDEDVRTEAARRLAIFFGSRDRAHLERMIADGTREAVRLLNKGRDKWTAAESTRAAQLAQSEAIVDAHDTASKALRAVMPIPTTYADNANWPPLPAAAP